MPKQMSRHSGCPEAAAAGPELAPHSGEPSHGPLTAEELQLAVRNHSMPLEALQIDTTPPGLHYLLTHFDIPFIDAEHWHLRIGGAVQRAAGTEPRGPAPGAAASASRSPWSAPATAGPLLRPRPLSQPWLLEGVGTAVWTGVPLAYLLAQAGVEDGRRRGGVHRRRQRRPGRRPPAVRAEPARSPRPCGPTSCSPTG